jgi:hypothetical protein
MWVTFVVKKTVRGKLSPNGLKFAQSGHPVPVQQKAIQLKKTSLAKDCSPRRLTLAGGCSSLLSKVAAIDCLFVEAKPHTDKTCLTNLEQGCQIFLCVTYQNGKIYTQ